MLLHATMPRGRHVLMSCQAAAKAGQAKMDGVSLQLVVHNTDRE